MVQLKFYSSLLGVFTQSFESLLYLLTSVKIS